LVFLLPDFGYPVYGLWFSCSQISAILFTVFDSLVPKGFYIILSHFGSVLPKNKAPPANGSEESVCASDLFGNLCRLTIMRRQLDFLSPKYFYIIWLSMSLDFISESYRASLNLISTFLFHESGFTLCNNFQLVAYEHILT
jgi:hypothetical protein